MTKENETRDKNGKSIRVGDAVRLQSIDWSGMTALAVQEQNDLKSMIGGVFTVEEIDEDGRATVSKWWDRGNGHRESHTLQLSPAEMERAPVKEEP